MFKVFKPHLFFTGMAALVFLFATFPGKGGYEGGQREVNLLSLRNDWWGFSTAFYYGGWPNFFGQWRFSLVIVQVIFFWLGIIFLFQYRKGFSKVSRNLFIILVIVGTTYVSQLWRDATFTAYLTFGLGLIHIAVCEKKKFRKIVLYSLGVTALIFGSLFKPIFSPIVALFFLFLHFNKFFPFPWKNYLSLPAILLTMVGIAVGPIAFDKQLVERSNMIRSFPEQQPMIYDLASLYCWGTNSDVKSKASFALQPFLRSGVTIDDMCGSLRTIGWDDLRRSDSSWKFASPIIQVNPGEKKKMNKLQSDWLNIVAKNTPEWIQVKFVHSTQVLTMANSFVKPTEDGFSSIPPIKKANHLIWNMIYYFSVILDKLRIFTVGALLLMIIFCLFNRVKGSQNNLKKLFLNNKQLFTLTLTGISLYILATIAFLANNGRYVFGFVLLIYFFLILENSEKSKALNPHQP